MRTILKLHRSLVADFTEPITSSEIATFSPADSDEWLALNNKIFVAHPDQGDWVMPVSYTHLTLPTIYSV